MQPAKTSIAFIALLYVAWDHGASADDPQVVKVFVLAGQSNMEGHAEIWICGDGEWTKTPFTNPDPYQLLDIFAALGQQGEVAIVMHGWAAPTDDDQDCKPSEHPSRRRMRLYIQLFERDLQTVIEWNDTKVIDVMPDMGTGFMASSIMEAIDNLGEDN